MGTLFAIMGKSGVGKTTLVKRLISLLKIKKVTSVTSRPMRKGEVEGVDYYFKTKQEILNLENSGKLLEFNVYHNNYYGIEKEELKGKEDKLIIVDPNGYRILSREYRGDVVPIYIYTTDKIRKERLLTRVKDENREADMKQIELRFLKDNLLFEGIEKNNRIHKVNNSYNLLSAVHEVHTLMQTYSKKYRN